MSSCPRRSPAELVALRERVLKARRADPDLTAKVLAERFSCPKSTIEKWLHASGLGQLRQEDGRGVLAPGKALAVGRRQPVRRPAPPIAPPPVLAVPLVWTQPQLLIVEPCPHPRHHSGPRGWRVRPRRGAPVAQEAFPFLAQLPVRPR